MEEKYICKKCGKEFKNEAGLKTHIKFCKVEVAKVTEIKKVKAMLRYDPTKRGQKAIYVGVNDKAYLVPYGVEVEVEDYIAEVIEEHNKRVEEYIKDREALKENDDVEIMEL